MGLNEIPIEVLKFLDDVGVCWLTNLFNKILSVNKIPNESGRSTLISINMNSGDIPKLMSHIMKL